VTTLPDARLTVTTVRIDSAPAFVELLNADAPLLWRRKGAGLVGHGEALRLTFSGANRMEDAARAWQHIVAQANVNDSVSVPGTGLVGLASFAFADDSPTTSVLVVPRLTVGRRDDVTWITTVSVDGDEAPEASVPHPSAVSQRASARLSTGTMSEVDYEKAVESAIARISAGELSKVVLARDLTGTLAPGSDIRSMVTELAHAYPDCWTFAIDGLYGASPETLVSVRGGVVDARVLAGTAARGADPSSDEVAASGLATSRKDLDEHAFAVRSVTDVLRPLTSHLIAAEAPFTLRLANLWHLATDVSGEVAAGVSALDLAAALHPTAAVAGSPTAAAVALIAELEPFDRGRYAGAVGWVGANGEGEWAIALRCVSVNGETVTAHAGAGIVADSVAATELRETQMKFRPVLDALAPLDD
jgi:menaquinone-specific isochorismate synthase